MKTSLFRKGRVFHTITQSLLTGIGSILNLSPDQSVFYPHDSMVRQDRDGYALRGDWQQVGRHLRSSMKNDAY